MKTLFLLTKTYPFGTEEQYIHNELPYLSAAFDQVIIYPNDYYAKGAEHGRVLPANVELLLLNQQFGHVPNTWRNYIFILKETLLEFITTDDKGSFFKNFKWNLLNFWTQIKLAGELHNALSRWKDHKLVFYSYWFHKSAILLSVLKTKGYISSFISRAHSVDLYHNDWGMINDHVKVPPFKMFKLRHVTKLFAVSEHGKNYLATKYPEGSSRFSFARLGIIPEENSLSKTKGAKFSIVTCSSIDVNKRVQILAEALSKIEIPFTWTHFGDGLFRGEVEKWISKFPSQSTAELKGFIPNALVKQFYAENQVDLFVNLSIVEGLPVSIMEAMMHGIPVLATAVYGTPEAVIEGENGFLLDVNFTTGELVSKIKQCCDHPEALKKMGQASRKIYLDRFNAEKNYTEFSNYLAAL